MQRNIKRLFPIDENERRELAQHLCLALRNVQAYGADHAVSATALRAFYESVVDTLDRFPEIEWSLAEKKVLLNGQPCDLHMADDVLARQMAACGLETFAFLDALSRIEIRRFVSWLATGVDPLGGQEAFAGIRISDSVYARISRDDYDAAAEEAGSEPVSGGRQAEHRGGVKQFDLDSMLAGEVEGMSEGTAGLDALAIQQQVSSFVSQQRLAEEQRTQMVELIQGATGDPEAIASLHTHFLSSGGTEKDWYMLSCAARSHSTSTHMANSAENAVQITQLRETFEILRARCANGHLDAASLTQELDKIRGSLDGLMQSIHTRTDTLVEKVDADRSEIARLEKLARESGAPIHLSREELLASLAEINQELAQPLTVSTALLALLSSGRVGRVDEKQQEIFKVAASSLERLEVVMKYLQRISGMPSTLAPDQGLLAEVYASSQKD